MRKNIKIALILLGGAIIFSILHNVFYGLFRIEEPVFFSLSLLSALGFLVFLGYRLVVYLKDLRKK